MVLLGFTEFYWVLLGPTRSLPSFTWFYPVRLSFTDFNSVLVGLSELRCVELGFIGFYWVVPSFTGSSWISLLRFYSILPSFTEFYRVVHQVSSSDRLNRWV